MNLINAVKLLATNVDYDIIHIPEHRDAIEEASLVVQKALDFDTNKVKIDLLAGRLKKYKKPTREVQAKFREV